MRDRVYEKDKQTSFAKNHSVLGSKCLLTDIDAIQSTENEFYNEYWYESGKPILRRFVEVKYKLTNYIKNQIKRIEKINTQTQMFSYMVYELNQYRKQNNLPLAEFYYIIQTDGDFPYYVFNVTGINSKLKFEYVGEVKNTNDYVSIFKF